MACHKVRSSLQQRSVCNLRSYKVEQRKRAGVKLKVIIRRLSFVDYLPFSAE